MVLFPIAINLLWKRNNATHNKKAQKIKYGKFEMLKEDIRDLLQNKDVAKKFYKARIQLKRLELSGKNAHWQRLSLRAQGKYLAKTKDEILRKKYKGKQSPLFINLEIENSAKEKAFVDAKMNVMLSFIGSIWNQTPPAIVRYFSELYPHNINIAK